jgi:hypothetical protein
MKSPCLAVSLACCSLLALEGRAFAQQPSARTDLPWSNTFPEIQKDIQSGQPLVILVVVPLCSNEQIDCGASWAGQPGRLETNLYWGAIWGARRFMQRERSPWQTVDVSGPADGLLQQVVLRRMVDGAAWGKTGQVEQLVALQAVHGSEIDSAVDRFWAYATRGGRLSFQDGGRPRDERVHVAAYNGHNRLMDGKTLPAESTSSSAIPSFVMACVSESYFAPSLRAAGSSPLLMTRTLMAPEGYLLEAIVRSLGENATRTQVREAAISAELKWLKIPPVQARYTFAP